MREENIFLFVPNVSGKKNIDRTQCKTCGYYNYYCPIHTMIKYENLTTSPVAQCYKHAGRSLLKLAEQQRTG